MRDQGAHHKPGRTGTHAMRDQERSPAMTTERLKEIRLGTISRHIDAADCPACAIHELLEALAVLGREKDEMLRSLTESHARALNAERQLAEKDEALRHYADELHWSLAPDPDPTNTGKPYYPEFTYDGGHKEPWTVAREALRAEPAKEEA